MKLSYKLLRGVVALSAVFCLNSCMEISSPGIVVETKQYKLSDKAQLVVTRHLNNWKNGSFFNFEWYVIKCKSDAGLETLLLRDIAQRGLFASEIPDERISVTAGGISYAYFESIVVFDNQCKEISNLYQSDVPWRTYIDPAPSIVDPRIAAGTSRVEAVVMNQTGHGLARLSWMLNNRSRELVIKTEDFGVHWTLPNSDVDVRNGYHQHQSK